MSSVQYRSSDLTGDKQPTAEKSAPPIPGDATATHPEIDSSSVGALCRSSWKRFASIWTKRFVLSLLAGQIVSLCITCTSVATEELTFRNWALPTTQTFFLYLSLFVTYTPYTIYWCMLPILDIMQKWTLCQATDGFDGWLKVIYERGWKYIILAACDVEGNFLVVKAYQYTDLLSCMLLEAWAIPVCMFFSYVHMRTRFHWTQILGVVICVAGLCLLVASDQITNKSWTALDKGKGDAFMIIGATLYGFTNATEEFLVRRSPLYEVLGQLGMWGMIINGVQASILEHKKMRESTWSGANLTLVFAYTAAMFVMYTVAPLLYRLASSTYYNLSLRSANFYGLIFGIFLFHYKPYWLYFPSFAVVISGLVVYFCHSTPEQEGKTDIRVPSYVTQHGKAVLEDSEGQREGAK
ncbi:solute carrier family 35 member SLC35F1/F2/F6 [Lactarius hatsudake]|nr:solute carrier family 35 member SLC35F1/F2/F6 [Lactarius hatsudake]